MKQQRTASGFTLIELIVAITLIGVCSATLFGFMATMDSRNAAILVNQQSRSIADAYLQEALSKRFAPQAGARNDVADYNFTDNGARDSSGALIAGLNSYTVQIVAAQTAFGAIASTDCYQVTVTVIDPFGESVSVVGYRILN
jgi:MSHA pilin protein MshD